MALAAAAAVVLVAVEVLVEARQWRAAEVAAPAVGVVVMPVVPWVLPVAQLLALVGVVVMLALPWVLPVPRLLAEAEMGVGVELALLLALFPAAVAVLVGPAVAAWQVATTWPSSPTASCPRSRSWGTARSGKCGTTRGPAPTRR